MSKFKANIDQLEDASFLLGAAYPGFNQLKGQLEEIYSEVNTEWKGFAGNTFQIFLRRQINSISALQDSINELKRYCDTQKSTLQHYDRIIDELNSILSFFGIGG